LIDHGADINCRKTKVKREKGQTALDIGESEFIEKKFEFKIRIIIATEKDYREIIELLEKC
jgi:uncharacterized protein (DUF1697 family)